MTAEDDRRLIDMLSRVVQRSRELQDGGALRDPTSRAEIDLLEHLLGVSQARLSRRLVSEVEDIDARAAALVALAQDACAASAAVRRGARATQQKTRLVRKRLYRARLITGSEQSSRGA